MAEARVFQDEFSCPVCLELLKDPVTIQCGHNYCKSCITDCWDHDDQKRVYRCPQCKQSFSPRPALARNTMLAEVVEKLKNTKLSADCYAGAGDVQCDVCTGRKYKAVKSCLVCLNSYCQNHLEQHESWFKGKRHNLTEATGRLQEIICQKHEKILEVFCRTDEKCICVLCMDEHQNHDTVSAAAQRTEKQHQLRENQKTLQQRIQQREKDLHQLREAVESHKHSAHTAVEDSKKIFTELIRSIDRSHSELIRLIRDQEKQVVSRAEGQMDRLKQEINDLKKRGAELEQLSQTQDHIQFLQSSSSLSPPPECKDVNDEPVSLVFSFDDLRESVHQWRNKLEDFCKNELKMISERVATTGVYYNQSPTYNALYLLPTAANVTPTKGPASSLSTHSEEYYDHNVPQPTVNPPSPQPGYFTKPCAVTSTQPSNSIKCQAANQKNNLGLQFTGAPVKVSSFEEVAEDCTKNTSSTDVSSKGFTFATQESVAFQFGSKDADFRAQANKTIIQTDAPQHKTTAPAPFDIQFVKKEGRWDCDCCLQKNDATATDCTSCKALHSSEKSNAVSQLGLGALFYKKDGKWDCDICLIRNEATSSHCVACQTANPDIKNKTSAALSSSPFTFSFASSSSQYTATGYKANFNPCTAFQFGTNKDKASPESSRSFTSEVETSSSCFSLFNAGVGWWF